MLPHCAHNVTSTKISRFFSKKGRSDPTLKQAFLQGGMVIRYPKESAYKIQWSKIFGILAKGYACKVQWSKIWGFLRKSISKIMKRKGMFMRYSDPKMPVPYNQTPLYSKFTKLLFRLSVSVHRIGVVGPRAFSGHLNFANLRVFAGRNETFSPKIAALSRNGVRQPRRPQRAHPIPQRAPPPTRKPDDGANLNPNRGILGPMATLSST